MEAFKTNFNGSSIFDLPSFFFVLLKKEMENQKLYFLPYKIKLLTERDRRSNEFFKFSKYWTLDS